MGPLIAPYGLDGLKRVGLPASAHQRPSFPNRDPMEIAFEDRCSRFDRYLKRLRANGDKQWGLVILEKSAHHELPAEPRPAPATPARRYPASRGCPARQAAPPPGLWRRCRSRRELGVRERRFGRRVADVRIKRRTGADVEALRWLVLVGVRTVALGAHVEREVERRKYETYSSRKGHDARRRARPLLRRGRCR